MSDSVEAAIAIVPDSVEAAIKTAMWSEAEIEEIRTRSTYNLSYAVYVANIQIEDIRTVYAEQRRAWERRVAELEAYIKEVESGKRESLDKCDELEAKITEFRGGGDEGRDTMYSEISRTPALGLRVWNYSFPGKQRRTRPFLPSLRRPSRLDGGWEGMKLSPTQERADLTECPKGDIEERIYEDLRDTFKDYQEVYGHVKK